MSGVLWQGGMTRSQLPFVVNRSNFIKIKIILVEEINSYDRRRQKVSHQVKILVEDIDHRATGNRSQVKKRRKSEKSFYLRTSKYCIAHTYVREVGRKRTQLQKRRRSDKLKSVPAGS